MKKRGIHNFFAVTLSGSLYRISDRKNKDGYPIVRRISGPKNPNMLVGDCLKNGQAVGISELGICLFRPHPRYGLHFDRMNSINWGGGTSGPVGLFLNRVSADKCISDGDFKALNKRYRAHTVAVLQKIGNNHPIFSISDRLNRLYELPLEPNTER